jgi:hypothetical protein
MGQQLTKFLRSASIRDYHICISRFESFCTPCWVRDLVCTSPK